MGACKLTAVCKLPCTLHHIKHYINCNIVHTCSRRSAAPSRYTPPDTPRDRSASRSSVAPVVVIHPAQQIKLKNVSDAALVQEKALRDLRMWSRLFDRMWQLEIMSELLSKFGTARTHRAACREIWLHVAD